MKLERVRSRYSDVLGTAVAWFPDGVIVRWEPNEGRTGEYRLMDLHQIIPLQEEPFVLTTGSEFHFTSDVPNQ